VGYFVAYSYEQQYFAYFGIPSELITVDWTIIINGIVSILALSFMSVAVFIFPVILRYSGIKLDIVGNNLTWIGSSNIFVLLISLQYYESNPYIWVLFILPLLLFLDLIVRPLISQRKIKGFRSKLIEEKKKIFKANENTPKWLLNYLIPISLFMLLFVVTYLIAIFQGRADASIKKEFLVVPDTPNLVVLQATQNRLICVKLNADNVSYTRNYIILPIENESGITLNKISIGPLKPEQ